MEEQQQTKVLRVALFGETNVGKSTFINQIANFRSCIVSKRPHTTKTTHNAIVTSGNRQIVFLDTPGLSTSKKKYSEVLNKITLQVKGNVDLNIFLLDGKKQNIPMYIVDLKNALETDSIVVVNKIDCVNKGKLLPYTEKISEFFKTIFFVSAYKGDGIEYLKSYLFKLCKDGDFLFDEGIKTDKEDIDLLLDRIQEVLFSVLDNEVPHNVGIKIHDIEPKKDGSQIFHIELMCSTKHRHILLGHIKEISTKIRKNLALFLNINVHVNVVVNTLKSL